MSQILYAMNILYHSRTLTLGGGRVHIDEIIKNLRKFGHHVTLVEPVAGGRTSKKASFMFKAIEFCRLPGRWLIV